jgi:recombination protein RecT
MAGRDLADAASAAVAKRDEQAGEQPRPPSLQAQISAPWVQEQIQKQLGPGYDAGVFLRSVVNAIKSAPDLEQCDPASVFGGMFTAAQLRLEIGNALGQAFLIPRQNRKNERYGWEASFQIGYKGLLALAYRTGVITGANAELVRVGDTFKRASSSERGPFYDLDYGAEHDNPETAIMGVIGFFWVRGSERPVWRYLTIDQVEERRPGFTREKWHKGPWATAYPEMVEKTGLINALRFAPKSAHLALATAVDDTVLTAVRERPEEVTAKKDGQNPDVLALTGDDDARA